MKKSETLKIIQRLVIMFPSFKFGELPEGFGGEKISPIDLWHEQIGDMEFSKAEQAVKNCIDRCRFVPTAADIREEYNKINGDRKNADNAFRDEYRITAGYYPDCGERDQYLELFRKRCGNDINKARQFRNALIDYLMQPKYQWLPNFGQMIMCFDVDNVSVPEEMMKLVQEYKKEPLPEESIKKFYRGTFAGQ